MTQDYKKALRDFAANTHQSSIDPSCSHVKGVKNTTIEAIEHALRIADKLMQEPSDGMIYEAYRSIPTRPLPMPENANNMLRITEFKAMRDQLLREIDAQERGDWIRRIR